MWWASITGCHVRHVGSLAAGSPNVGIVVYGPALVEHNFVEDVIVSSGSFDGGVMFLGNGTVVRDNTFESAGSCSFIVIGDEASLFDNAVSEPTTTCFAANVVAVEIGPTEPADTSTSPSANIQH